MSNPHPSQPKDPRNEGNWHEFIEVPERAFMGADPELMLALVAPRTFAGLKGFNSPLCCYSFRYSAFSGAPSNFMFGTDGSYVSNMYIDDHF